MRNGTRGAAAFELLIAIGLLLAFYRGQIALIGILRRALDTLQTQRIPYDGGRGAESRGPR